MGKQRIWCIVLCQSFWLWGALTLATSPSTLFEPDNTSPSSDSKIVTEVQHLKVPDTTTGTVTDTPKQPEISHANVFKQIPIAQALIDPESMSTQINKLAEPVQEKNDSQATPSIEGNDFVSLPAENGTTQKDTVMTSANEMETTTHVSTGLLTSISTGDDKRAVIDIEPTGYTTEPTVSKKLTTLYNVTKIHGVSGDTGLKTSRDGLLTSSPESNITETNYKATGTHSGSNEHKTPTPKKDNSNNTSRLFLYVVLICLLLLILAVIVILVLRKKRRSRSQNFSKRVKKGDSKDVWAGQVPELAGGEVTVGADGLVNGMAVPLLGDEQEMTTFVIGEKKGDSGIEIVEAEAGTTKKVGGEEMKEKAENLVVQEEQKVPKDAKLEIKLNGEVEAKEEQFPLPPVEQNLVGNKDKAI
ncbi:leukosialin-like [Xenopus laevis]|uniref:Leukosialin-like n=1 Tax=Xenopus laevis TaxID=8355 RepID=A0A8J0TWG6_XENLA|nr:leukosialin-like [Xenopus laevis]